MLLFTKKETLLSKIVDIYKTKRDLTLDTNVNFKFDGDTLDLAKTIGDYFDVIYFPTKFDN